MVETWKVSASVLPMLGLKPVIGRLFTAEEDDAAPNGAALISWEFWQARFGGRNDVFGQSLGLTYSYVDPHVRTIVGVLPRGVALQGRQPDVILPLGVPRWSSSSDASLRLVARLASPAALQAARSGASELVPKFTRSRSPLDATIVTMADDVYGEPSETTLLAWAALIVLIVACGSAAAAIATSDVVERNGELAVRLAIGATPHRRTQRVGRATSRCEQLFALVAAAPISFWLVEYAVATLLPSLATVNVSIWNTSAFAVSLLISTSVIFIATTLPAVVVARWLGAGPPTASLPRATSRLTKSHRLLIGAQLAACMALVVCACLLEQTIWRLTSRPLGFDPEGLVVVSFTPTTRPADAAGNRMSIFQSAAHVEALAESIRRLPGVTGAAAVRDAPFASNTRWSSFSWPENRSHHESKRRRSRLRIFRPCAFV